MKPNIAENVKRYRNSRNWTQAELAENAKVGQSAVSEIESGNRNPRADTIEKLAFALGCTYDELLGGTKSA